MKKKRAAYLVIILFAAVSAPLALLWFIPISSPRLRDAIVARIQQISGKNIAIAKVKIYLPRQIEFEKITLSDEKTNLALQIEKARFRYHLLPLWQKKLVGRCRLTNVEIERTPPPKPPAAEIVGELLKEVLPRAAEENNPLTAIGVLPDFSSAGHFEFDEISAKLTLRRQTLTVQDLAAKGKDIKIFGSGRFNAEGPQCRFKIFISDDRLTQVLGKGKLFTAFLQRDEETGFPGIELILEGTWQNPSRKIVTPLGNLPL